MSLYLVEGWTGGIDYTLKADDTAYDLTGCSVQIVAYDKNNTLLTLTGSMSIVSAVAGSVRFSPGAGDILASNSKMHVRFKVTRSDSKIVFFPNGEPEEWIINK